MSTNDTLRGLLREANKHLKLHSQESSHPGQQELMKRIKAALAEPVSGGAVLPERSNERGSDGKLTYEARARNACIDEMVALNGGSVAGQAVERATDAHGRGWGEVVPSWLPCNQACDPEFNGFRDSKCDCEQARRAMAKASPICDCRQGRDACTCKGGE